MKKHVFEAAKKQWEKPTEPHSLFVKPAQVTVCAENEEQALELAKAALCKKFYGTGVIPGEAVKVAEYDLPADWSYGYGDGRGTGTPEQKKALADDCKR